MSFPLAFTLTYLLLSLTMKCAYARRLGDPTHSLAAPAHYASETAEAIRTRSLLSKN